MIAEVSWYVINKFSFLVFIANSVPKNFRNTLNQHLLEQIKNYSSNTNKIIYFDDK